MNVAELMNRNAVSVLPSTLVADAARIMLAHRISGLPVLDEQGHLVGIITEGDLIRHCRTHLAAFKVPRGIRFVAAEDLPTTTTGKIQKYRLIESWNAGQVTDS